MISRILNVLSAAAGGAALAACSAFGSKAAPEPDYTLVTSDGPFEIRQYPELVVVKTPMDGGEGENPAFQRLFRYISGANGGKREIAMTAPVLEGTGEKIAMTAPVLEQEQGAEIAMTAPVLESGAGQTDMAFILPADYTADTAPLPTDPKVRLETIPPRRVAVITYNGRSRPAMEAEQRAKLEAWIADRGLTATGPAEVAQYNPPWTIPTLRRNEILIPVAD